MEPHSTQGLSVGDRACSHVHLSVPSSSAYACFFCLSGSTGEA